MKSLLSLLACVLTLGANAQDGGEPAAWTAADSLAALVSAESYCADLEDLRRVATVVANRVADPRFPDSYAAVIGDPAQFPSTLREDFGQRCPDAEAVARDVLAGARYLEADVLYFYNPDITAAGGRWLERLRAGTVVRGARHHFVTLGGS